MYIFFKPKDKIYLHVLIVTHIKKLPYNYVLTKKNETKLWKSNKNWKSEILTKPDWK